MIVTSTKCKELLNISTSITTYDTLISLYIPYVTESIAEIANHRFHDAGHWFYDDGLTFTSSNKTIQLDSDSTTSFLTEFSTGDTIDILGSYNNNGFFTVSSISSSFVMVVEENLIAEASTTYDVITTFYRCKFPEYLKPIAAKMVWWNVQNTTTVNSDIQSESLGSYSVTYKTSNTRSYLYPGNLIAGIKKKAGSY